MIKDRHVVIFENSSDVDPHTRSYYKQMPFVSTCEQVGVREDLFNMDEFISGTQNADVIIFHTSLNDVKQVITLAEIFLANKAGYKDHLEIHVIKNELEPTLNKYNQMYDEFKHTVGELVKQFNVISVGYGDFEVESGGTYFKRIEYIFDDVKLEFMEDLFICRRPHVIDPMKRLRELVFKKPSPEKFKEFQSEIYAMVDHRIEMLERDNPDYTELLTHNTNIMEVMTYYLYTHI